MKGKKLIIWMLAIIMIGAGLLSVMEVAADQSQKPPSLKVLKIRKYVGFPGDTEAKASYDVDPETGCILNFFDKEGKPIKSTSPSWLGKDKVTWYLGSLNDSQCQQGLIAIGSCPVEFWGWKDGSYYCKFAWDYINYRFYQPCSTSYPPCN